MTKPLLLTAALFAVPVLAQETPPPPPEAPPAAVADAPLANDPPEPQQDPGGRVRWGIAGGAGWHFPYSAIGFGLQGNIGYQFSNIFSAYVSLGGNFGLGFGGSASGSSASVSITAINHYVMAVLAEAMFGDLFYVAGGPGVALGGLAVAGVSVQSDGGAISALAASGAKPTLDLRLGFGFGKAKGAPSFRRGGFNLGLQALVMFHPDTAVTRVQGDSMGGSVSVTTNELITTVTPMLMLGYEGR